MLFLFDVRSDCKCEGAITHARAIQSTTAIVTCVVNNAIEDCRLDHAIRHHYSSLSLIKVSPSLIPLSSLVSINYQSFFLSMPTTSHLPP